MTFMEESFKIQEKNKKADRGNFPQVMESLRLGKSLERI